MDDERVCLYFNNNVMVVKGLLYLIVKFYTAVFFPWVFSGICAGWQLSRSVCWGWWMLPRPKGQGPGARTHPTFQPGAEQPKSTWADPGPGTGHLSGHRVRLRLSM